MAADTVRDIEVPAERLAGWIQRFGDRHGALTWSAADDGGARAEATDGAVAVIRLAIPTPAEPDATAMSTTALDFDRFGLVLVRRGGFAIGRVDAGRVVASRTGTRYVQGQTKAGGQSQKRYARRRANQAAALVRSAAEAVDEVLAEWSGRVVGGGDRALVRQVLDTARTDLAPRLVPRWLDVGNPRRRDLDTAVSSARAARISLNALA
ncbi:MAG TPA: acVLRF1 family peptidyl-tRNA hydrolase [Nocardioidaceae bacterium]|nr:acVLRF1 family peptidyl-tRNA hydrolase [Nocardioidaceae bacterium]